MDLSTLLQSEEEYVPLSNKARVLVTRMNIEDCSCPERKQIIINVEQFTRSRCKQF